MTSRAIVHVDGDAFFASCEVAQNEALRGKPVVVGKDKGMALAVSYEAKKCGISRGMPIGEIRKLCPQVIVTDVNYELYKIYTRRMYAIVRRFTPKVEEYSVDECFADISHIENQEERIRTAHAIQDALRNDLGITCSIGLAPTKVLAKVASKVKKPAGFTVITKEAAFEFLESVPIGKVWGIGPSTSAFMVGKGIRTALDFAMRPKWWVKENLAEPYQAIWHELNSQPVSRVNPEPHIVFRTVMKTRTFRPTRNKEHILSELFNNLEHACRRLRRYRLAGKELSFFLKTQRFMYHSDSFCLFSRSAVPLDFTTELSRRFDKIYKPGVEYRATGVVIRNISWSGHRQADMFGMHIEAAQKSELFALLDAARRKCGVAVRLARSLKANENSRVVRSTESWPLPCWGEAR